MKFSVIGSPLGAKIFKTYARVFHDLHFRIATPSDADDLYRFRFTIYVQAGYIRAEDYPEKRFSDKFDPYSISVIALKSGKIMGAGRATHYSVQGLPMLEYFNVALPGNSDKNTLVEMGRFMVDPVYRGKSRLVSLGMSLQLKAHIKSNPSIRWLIAFMPEKVRRAFCGFIPFQPLQEYPVNEAHLRARNLLPGYWAQGNIHPVIAEATELLS